MENLRQILSKKVEATFWNGTTGRDCASTVAAVMADYFDIDNPVIPDVARAFGGGYAYTHKSVCGAISGGLIIVGVQSPDSAKELSGKLLEFVADRGLSWNCPEILDIDFDDEEQVTREADPKRVSICKPLLIDICVWLAETLD